jgi:hypothetical protein
LGLVLLRSNSDVDKFLPSVQTKISSSSDNKSHHSPKAYCFSKTDERKPFLIVLNPFLTFLNSTCLSFTPNKCTHWFASIIEPYRVVSQVPSYNYFALLVLVYHWFWAITIHGVGSLLSHVIMISLVPSCICPVRVSMRMSSLITPKINSVWKFLPWWRMSPLTLGYEKILFPFRAPAQVIEPRGSSNEACYNQSHEAQSDSTRCDVTHTPKGKLHEGPRSCSPFNYPDTRYLRFSVINASYIVSCTPPHVNLGMRFF